jgi:hypothetical protein
MQLRRSLIELEDQNVQNGIEVSKRQLIVVHWYVYQIKHVFVYVYTYLSMRIYGYTYVYPWMYICTITCICIYMYTSNLIFM